ncbi:hypothetical protein V2J09_017385 [Rumex salicifolius]
MKGEMAIIAVVMAVFLGAIAVESKQASPPAVDCSTLVLGLADCLTFVTNGSTIAKPEGQCCSGLKTVLRTDAQCLCDAFKNSASFGIALNLTKAMALPTACHVTAPSAKNCGVSLSPTGAPGEYFACSLVHM